MTYGWVQMVGFRSWRWQQSQYIHKLRSAAPVAKAAGTGRSLKLPITVQFVHPPNRTGRRSGPVLCLLGICCVHHPSLLLFLLQVDAELATIPGRLGEGGGGVGDDTEAMSAAFFQNSVPKSPPIPIPTHPYCPHLPCPRPLPYAIRPSGKTPVAKFTVPD